MKGIHIGNKIDDLLGPGASFRHFLGTMASVGAIQTEINLEEIGGDTLLQIEDAFRTQIEKSKKEISAETSFSQGRSLRFHVGNVIRALTDGRIEFEPSKADHRYWKAYNTLMKAFLGDGKISEIPTTS